MNENSFIQIFHQGYRRFALSFSLHFLEQVLSSIRLSLARNESVSQPTHFACAYTKKGNTHTQATRTHRKWGRTFFGRFLHVYTYVYCLYIHTYICLNSHIYQICHCCFYCVLKLIIIHTRTLIYPLCHLHIQLIFISATLLIVYNGMCVYYCFIFCTKNFGFVHVGFLTWRRQNDREGGGRCVRNSERERATWCIGIFLYWITAFRILCRFARFFSFKHIIIVIRANILNSSHFSQLVF